MGADAGLPGPRPVLFFGPAQIARRSAPLPKSWGAAELQRPLALSWRAFIASVDNPAAPWMRVENGQGAEAVRAAVLAQLEGRAFPRGGQMLSLQLRVPPRRAQAQARRPEAEEPVTMNARLPTLTPRLPRDGAGWAFFMRHADVPVLARTAAAIEELRELEDAVDAHLLAESIGNDPLMTLKVLVHVARQPWKHRTTDAETVTEALVMLGIGPFFRAFGGQLTVDEHLAAQPAALAGLRQVVRRAHRAASFALGFAVHRMDHDAPVIHQAALLHDFAEMLLWCHAPAAALAILQRQQTDPALRSSEAQSAVLGVALADLQQQLMKAWRLPELLVRISDEHHADSAQVRNVLLAVRLARHTAHGWDNPAVPDDLAEISTLLNLGIGPAEKLLLDLDA